MTAVGELVVVAQRLDAAEDDSMGAAHLRELDAAAIGKRFLRRVGDLHQMTLSEPDSRSSVSFAASAADRLQEIADQHRRGKAIEPGTGRQWPRSSSRRARRRCGRGWRGCDRRQTVRRSGRCARRRAARARRGSWRRAWHARPLSTRSEMGPERHAAPAVGPQPQRVDGGPFVFANEHLVGARRLCASRCDWRDRRRCRAGIARSPRPPRRCDVHGCPE